MANAHVYLGIENLALSSGQRGTLVTGLEALGQSNQDRQPAKQNHWATRNDNDAVIFEALFNEDNISIAGIKTRLANLFGVDVSLISHGTQQSAYGLVVTYTYLATDYLRIIAFGHDGSWPAWSVSGDAARAYKTANAAEWEPVD